MELRCSSYWFSFLILISAFMQLTFSDKDGFLSLSCGGTTSFIDSSNISWIPDNAYVNTGQITTVDFLDGTFSLSLPLRYFLPRTQGRQCYSLPINNVSSIILIRAKFVYKNYDGFRKPPLFSVSLGTTMAATVNLSNHDPWIEEFIVPVKKEIIPLCFHSIPNGGFPIISSLELRPLPRRAYGSANRVFTSRLLRRTYRVNCGYVEGSLKYPVDKYDRIWDADEDFSPFHVSAGFDIQDTFNLSSINEGPPSAVLQTARVLARWNKLTYKMPLNHQGDYYIILYFAGILPVAPTFDVLINGNIVRSNFTVKRWEASDMFFTMYGINSLNITLKTISYFPLINAFEVYEILNIPLESSSTTVSALQVIQKSAALNLGWEDDPCSPTLWERIGCEGNLVTSLDLSGINLRSISPTFGDLLDLKTLELQNTSLSGEIQYLGSLQYLEKLNLSFNQLTEFGSELEDLINLQVLDLRNNSLYGKVPDSLGELHELQLLDLENNKLQGPLPLSLSRKSLKIKSLGNLCLSFSTICKRYTSTLEEPQVTIVPPRKRQGHNHLEIIIVVLGVIILCLSIITFSILLYLKRKKTDMIVKAKTDPWKWGAAKVFSYKEIRTITNNFKEVIGRGSFGSVYLGKLDNGKQVAVKVQFGKSPQGADSFINEVSKLLEVRHENLVSLEGCCYESKQHILVYDYLPGGSLANSLYGSNRTRVAMSWARRLKIAVDAAKGLNYLHNGCNPRIIHGDVKSRNILLDTEMNAKVSDFGLSKQVTQATAGYIDPEYFSTRQLTEKSDIYSFGVVLLEIICGREPLSHAGSPDSFNLVLWAKPYLQAGAFEVVDESIKGSFDEESMRKAALIASRCVERDALRRPTIEQVFADLKEAYSIQLSYLAPAQLTI